MNNPYFIGLGLAQIFCGSITIATQILIINLIQYEETGVQIGAGIWCGIVFVFAGIITMLPRAPSVVRIRNVMLIISITFASFFIYWSFLYVFIHKLGYTNSE